MAAGHAPRGLCGHETKLVTGGVRVCTRPKGHNPSYEHNEGVLEGEHPYLRFVPAPKEGDEAPAHPTTAEGWTEWQRRREVPSTK